MYFSRRAAFATGTMSNLRTQWTSFIAFCLYFNLTFLPASVNTVCMYIQYLSRSFKSIQSVKNYLNGVRVLHLYAGFEFNMLQLFEVKILLKGLTRLKQHRVKRAAAITPDILLDLFHVMDLDDPLVYACWVAFLMAFFLMLRKSNLVPTSVRTFDLDKHLSRGNILIVDDGLLVNITWSKTNQFGARLLQVPIPSIPGSVLCPVSAYKRLVQLVPADSSLPAFTYKVRPKLMTVTQYQFVNVLRSYLNKAGYHAESFSGHSFRRGGASFAFASGVPGELIKAHGDWASDAYLTYIDLSLFSRWQVGLQMRNHIISASRH